MEFFIVHIYRREDRSGRLIGMLEEAGTGVKMPFRTARELMGFLGGKKNKETRQAMRLRLRLPVRVKGRNTRGRSFTEYTWIEDLSSGGAYLYMKNPVARNARLKMLIDPENSGVELSARVVRHAEGPCAGQAGVGVVFQRMSP